MSEQLEKARNLFQEGNYHDSYRIYSELSKQYPDDEDIKHELLQCKKHLAFETLVKEADELFQVKKLYEQALEKYDQALKLNDDFLVEARRDQCAEKISGSGSNDDILDSFRDLDEPDPVINEQTMYDYIPEEGQSGSAGGSAPPPSSKPSVQADYYVGKSAGNDFSSISKAVANAREGSTILVRSGIYLEDVYVRKNLTIIAEDNVSLTSLNGSAFRIETAQASISGFKIDGRAAKNDKKAFAIAVPQGKLYLKNCNISNDSIGGIGVFNKGTYLDIENCEIHDTGQAGIFFYESGRGTIKNCRIHSAGTDGLSVTEYSEVNVTESSFFKNAEDGICYQSGATGNITDCKMYQNGVDNLRTLSGASPNVINCQISRAGKANIGIGENCAPRIEKCQVFESKISGIIVHKGASPEITECHIFGSGQAGVYYYDNGQGRIRHCEVYRNQHEGITAEKKGGKVYISDCKIYENQSFGVKAKEGSKLNIQNCSIYNNKASGLRADQSEVQATNLSISDHRDSAGLEIINQADVRLEQVEISKSKNSNILMETGSKLSLNDCKSIESGAFGLLAKASHVESWDSSFLKNAYSGVLIKEKTNARFLNNTIEGNGENGMFVLDGSKAEIERSSLSGNGGSGVKIYRQSHANIRNSSMNHNEESGIRTKEQGTANYSGCKMLGNTSGGVTES